MRAINPRFAFVASGVLLLALKDCAERGSNGAGKL
jgi:hypothetical protein